MTGRGRQPVCGECTAKVHAILQFVPPVRTCRVTVKDIEGTGHHVDVQASSLFEAAAAAIAAFRQHAWAAHALTANATLRVEVQLPPIVHDVPMKAVERWSRTPSVSPKEKIAKQRATSQPVNRRTGEPVNESSR